jgi:hypothetical protein
MIGRLSVAAMLLIACISSSASAGNVDLSTVPSRDTVQLTIYNSEDLTLVRETRKITFKKGVNPLQFSWAGTLIDPTSVELKFLSQADKLEVQDTTFPHDRPQVLYWNVKSEFDGEAAVQITYFTSGISWSADYLCVADAAEATMRLEGFVRVTNNSGEEYEDAQVRLVVGTINLVEKIAQLARVSVDDVKKMDSNAALAFRYDALRDAERKAGDKDRFADQAEVFDSPAPKNVVKEGLSEYFIYTIEGTETIPNGWSKRLRSFEGSDVPFKIEYRYRPAEYGEQLVRMYILRNDEESKLGTTPLPDGVVRVFRDNGRDGFSYLTQQSIKYIPIGDKIELNLGVDPEVIFELVKLRTYRDNIWLQVGGTSTYKKLGAGDVVVEGNSTVAGWEDHEICSQRVRNYTGKPIDVEVRRSYQGHVVFRSALDPKLHDYQTVEFKRQVPSRTKVDLVFEVVRKQGYLAKQNNVTLETAELNEADALKTGKLGAAAPRSSRLPGLSLLAALGSLAGWLAMRFL